MLRVFPALTVVASLLGCAFDAPAPQPPLRSKIVPVVKVRTCTTAVKAEDVCSVPKSCPQIATCAEAYYRLTTCGEWKRDGGVAGNRNGIPCEDKCGKDAKEMAQRITKQPFFPPTQEITVCDLPS